MDRFFAQLDELLKRLHGAGYGGYKRLQGRVFRDRGLELRVIHVQADPFAPPSTVAVRVERDRADLPAWAFANSVRRVACADFIHRNLARLARQWAKPLGTGRSGEIDVPRPAQEVLQRSTVTVFDTGDVLVRLGVGLPATGRRVRGREAAELLCHVLPRLVLEATVRGEIDLGALRTHVETVEDATWLREQVTAAGLVAFVADGAILPRRSGVDDRPMGADEAVPFSSPPSLRKEFELPNRGKISGMAIPAGVTLIVGGAYHGKSTLLRALERGVYNHVPGDGREFVVADATAVKIRAEDGRYVAGTDVCNFIAELPTGADTTHFVTQSASGSTSQAAAIIEALEVGAKCLLIDEDTSATNLMVRDARMQRLVPGEYEPITPYVDRVGYLFRQLGVSSILVVGGNGDYLDVADRVICMREYRPIDVTEEARRVARELPTGRVPVRRPWRSIRRRLLVPETIDPSRGRKACAVRARGRGALEFGSELLDLAAVEQIVESGQVQAIGLALARARELLPLARMSPGECAVQIESLIREQGLDWLDRAGRAVLSEFRAHELAAALNRLRSLRTRPAD